jgi:tRNA threonylcarbamoyladenosine biosynthesis protein TsaE
VTSLVLPTPDDTRAYGKRLGAVLRAGDLVVLNGPLGAGKTVLAQGIGAGMGVAGRIVSPTFVIARVHQPSDGGGATLVHVDAYRLRSLSEVDDLDLDATMAESVVVVEWGGGLVEQLADEHLEVRLRREPGSEQRMITLVPHGAGWAARLQHLG